MTSLSLRTIDFDVQQRLSEIRRGTTPTVDEQVLARMERVAAIAEQFRPRVARSSAVEADFDTVVLDSDSEQVAALRRNVKAAEEAGETVRRLRWLDVLRLITDATVTPVGAGESWDARLIEQAWDCKLISALERRVAHCILDSSSI